MTRINSFVDSLHRLPQEETDGDPYYERWGFTIYRTYYGSGSDQQWDKLLQNIVNGVRYQLKMHDGEPADKTQAEELFLLDARSDPATLDGLTLEEVRQVYHEGKGGLPLNTDKNIWRLFMLADAEVLANPGMIKCVAADYNDADHVQTHLRAGPRRYFGWLRMNSAKFLCLWFQLDIYSFPEIGGFRRDGPDGVWDAECC